MNIATAPLSRVFDPNAWLTAADGACRIDLSHPMQKGMPIHPAHPPFHITLNNRHGDVLRCCGHSSSNELMVTSTHSSTHIDALCHVSEHGALYGKFDAGEQQQGTDLFKVHGAETIAPIFRRGVLLDVARSLGVAALAPAYEITAADLEAAEEASGTSIEAGDVVLVRTGWAAYWSNSPKYLGLDSAGAPGPGAEGGQWLAARKPFSVGSDTSAFEVMNHHNITLEVHMILIAQNGIHIIENLALEELGAAAPGLFAFVAQPLRISGATGSPIRPIALF
ncbi:UNVERIFIED_ORG: kynurenine formamidase [Xanthobacter viscosus]|uniref:Cyclase family protein n=1 Tax=Xanthobacter autotrophicus TaxID=280 RepID=A0A6C1KS34_XANAU|nr:cyclase family protein [Xanthobacter autotrophicus]TLX41423.1 cyclase family protein [Xanthobacter autotrophicus]